MAKIIPTLFINDQSGLKTPQDIVAYLLRFMVTNPGQTSSQIESTLLSMRKLVAEHTEDINALPAAIQQVLDASVKRYLPTCRAIVTGTKVTETAYTLNIAVEDSVGTPILSSNDFVIENGVFKLITEVRDIPETQGD